MLSKRTLKMRQQQSVFRNNRMDSTATARLESTSGLSFYGLSTLNRPNSMNNVNPRKTSSIKMISNPLQSTSGLSKQDPLQLNNLSKQDPAQLSNINRNDRMSSTCPNVPEEDVSNDIEDRRFQSLEFDLEGTSSEASITGRSHSDSSHHDSKQRAWDMERQISIELTELLYRINSFDTAVSSESLSSSGKRQLSIANTMDKNAKIGIQSSQPPQMKSERQSSTIRHSLFSFWRK